MGLYAIGDFHLSFTVNKPMDVFDKRWKNHVVKIEKYWKKKETTQDTVVITGDHSWGRNLEECRADLDFIMALPGRKILLRGNHDFVNYTGDFKPEWGKKKALPQEEVASIIRSASKGSVVRDSCDRHSCYGYFDRNGIRYILIDTSDHVADSTVIYGMSDNQIDWILSEAVLKAPQGSGIVLLSHIPLAGQLFQDFVPSHVEMRRCLLGAVRAEAVEFAGKIYDFAGRKDLNFLMVLSGHRHRDSGDNSDGILQILTGNDSLTPNPRIESPAVGERGTVLEHCIDYVSVSEDFSTDAIIRIGRGQNRIFDVKK